MAAAGWTLLLLLCCFLQGGLSFGLFDDQLGDTDGCESICSNSYPPHTYEKGVHLAYCRRGCRFFTIIDFVHDGYQANQTRDACAQSCKDAYEVADDKTACVLGCDAQVTASQRRRDGLHQMETEELSQNIYPLMYVHSMYSNMVDKLWQHMRVSWSFYMQADNGRLVVIRSQPQYYTEYTVLQDLDNTGEGDYKTSNYLETNIAALDNSATPNLKNSQLRPLETDTAGGVQMGGMQMGGVQMGGMQMGGVQPGGPSEEHVQFDWLGCIARKTGMPRMLLSMVILLSAMVMIWLCFTTAATAPDQRVASQKLSIYGDLDYLKTLDNKELLASIHPQEAATQAAPLPIKITVERI